MAAVRRVPVGSSRYSHGPGEAAGRVSSLLARRIAECVEAVRAGTVISLEDGWPVTLSPAISPK
jgi:hypothetical protein